VARLYSFPNIPSVFAKTDFMQSRNKDIATMDSWTLWYHDPMNSDYSLESYIKIAEMKDIATFWTIVDAISPDAWSSGMFFFMKTGIRPLWDAPENDRGGAWSKKVDAHDTNAVFLDCMVHCGHVVTEGTLSYHQGLEHDNCRVGPSSLLADAQDEAWRRHCIQGAQHASEVNYR